MILEGTFLLYFSLSPNKVVLISLFSCHALLDLYLTPQSRFSDVKEAIYRIN